MFWFLFITKRSVYRWKRNGKVDKLIHAVEKGNYKVQLLAVEALGDLKSEAAIPLLINLLHNPSRRSKRILIASIKALEKIGLTPQSHAAILTCKENWKYGNFPISLPATNKNEIDHFDPVGTTVLMMKLNKQLFNLDLP